MQSWTALSIRPSRLPQACATTRIGSQAPSQRRGRTRGRARRHCTHCRPRHAKTSRQRNEASASTRDGAVGAGAIMRRSKLLLETECKELTPEQDVCCVTCEWNEWTHLLILWYSTELSKLELHSTTRSALQWPSRAKIRTGRGARVGVARWSLSTVTTRSASTNQR